MMKNVGPNNQLAFLQKRRIPLLLLLVLIIAAGVLAIPRFMAPAHVAQSASQLPTHKTIVPSPSPHTDTTIIAQAITVNKQDTVIAQSPPGRPDHVVIVVEENHTSSAILGSTSAPYINSLAKSGALFANSFAITHPSEPNYLALFSGSTQGMTDDSCPHTFATPNLGGNLFKAGLTFAGYSESMGNAGYTGCQYPPSSPTYARKHNPWVNFNDVPTSANQPLTSFPTDYTTLPTISIVVPNLLNDMHDGTIQQGDSWLQQHIDDYVQWAKTHNSLLIVTWDEDDGSTTNKIPTFAVGPMVKVGTYNETITHYTVLRTLEDMYNLPHIGNSASAQPILDCWGN